MNIDEIRAIKRLAIETAKICILFEKEHFNESYGYHRASASLDFAAQVLQMEFDNRVKQLDGLSNQKGERDEIHQLITFLRAESDKVIRREID